MCVVGEVSGGVAHRGWKFDLRRFLLTLSGGVTTWSLRCKVANPESRTSGRALFLM